jgi:hypothetical protein
MAELGELARCPRMPKGFRPKALGCEARGSHAKDLFFSRNAVAAGTSRGREKGKGRNRVAVDDFVWSRTQGRLADSPTLGWRTQSPWDCQNGGAFELRGWRACDSSVGGEHFLRPFRTKSFYDPNQTLACLANVRCRSATQLPLGE